MTTEEQEMDHAKLSLTRVTNKSTISNQRHSQIDNESLRNSKTVSIDTVSIPTVVGECVFLGQVRKSSRGGPVYGADGSDLQV